MEPTVKKPSCRSGVYFEQGSRSTMEDTHVAMDDVSKLYEGVYGSYYAVFDGHGGRTSAEFCEKNLLNYFIKEIYEQESKNIFANVSSALTTAFLKIDDTILQQNKTKDGSTAAVIFIASGMMWTANLGDTEILVGNSSGFKILTLKHKPSLEIERIKKEGGCVYNGRVNGTLAVSRAFGDSYLKKPFLDGNCVSCEPHISTHVMNNDKFVIIACDGLWDVTTYKEAYVLVKTMMEKGGSPTQIATALVKEALANLSSDNITVIVVFL